MFKIIIFSVCVILCLEGCTTVKYAEQLLILKGVSDSQKEIRRYLAEQKVFFKKLLEDMKNNKIELGMSKKDFLIRYGNPVIIQEGSNLFVGEILLYRNPTEYFNSEKIYLYFDTFGKLVNWEHSPYN